ncbi:hypothetical protein BMS3Bbin03_02736 [bacterium BMS3Bbin03]|nr:hypothetical protein BMS3Bbin03_02736 [bacterium BMS3Bbin03]
MKRLLAAAALVFALIGTTLAQTVYSDLFVLNGLGETVSKIGLTEDRIWNNLYTTGDVPNQIRVWGDSLYILNSVSSTLQIVNLSAGRQVAEIDLGVNKNPWNFAYSKSSGKIFITNLMANSVSVVDVAAKAVVDSIDVGGSPEGILVVGNRVYVTNTAYDAATYTYGQGTVLVIDALSGTVIDTINTPANPQALAVDSGGRIHVVCTGNFGNVAGSVVILNPATNAIVDTVRVGGTPGEITITQSGKAYLSAGGWVGNGVVLKYDALTDSVLRGTNNPIITGLGAMSVLADNAGHVFVSAFSDDRVDVIDVSADSVVQTYNVGDGPQSLALWKTTVSNVTENGAAQQQPLQFKLEQNYPNPVRAHSNAAGRTNFTFRLPRNETVTLQIYNILGEEVATIFNGVSSAGEHTVQMNLSGLSAGLYFYRLKSNGTALTRKLLIVR